MGGGEWLNEPQQVQHVVTVVKETSHTWIPITVAAIAAVATVIAAYIRKKIK